MLPAMLMVGARGRLLPPSVPFRYFGAAAVFHVLAWAMLLYGSDNADGFLGGPGPALASLHLLTLGVLAMTAVGAALQLLPVATRKPVGSTRAAGSLIWLLAPGVALTTYGFGFGAIWAMEGGGALTGLGLMIFAVLLVRNLISAHSEKDMRVVIAHAWIAALALIALITLGLLLITDWRLPIWSDRASIALIHAVLAGYGFMGMLVLGLSYVLVPMFALAHAPPERLGVASALTGATALILAVAGMALHVQGLLIAGIFIGFGCIGLYFMGMNISMKARMKKMLGGSFILIRTAWVLLPLSVLDGLLLSLGVPVPGGVALFGFLLIFGWLLTFLMGVLQRIMPFLASMHAAKKDGKTALVSQLTAEEPLRVHLWCHLAALALVALGLVLHMPVIIRLGALAGLAGAVSFAIFAALLWRRSLPSPPSA